jgi:hypothetical protein
MKLKLLADILPLLRTPYVQSLPSTLICNINLEQTTAEEDQSANNEECEENLSILRLLNNIKLNPILL